MESNSKLELIEIADRHYAADDPNRKLNHYFLEYERIFAPIRNQVVRILELGVFAGQSLLIWHEYMPKAIIVGLDLKEIPESIRNKDRIHYIQGSQIDEDALDRAVEMAGGEFDVIVDDASHIGHLTKKSFMHLFPRHLRPGGAYVLEDIGSSFLPGAFAEAVHYVAPPIVDSLPEQMIFPSYQNGMSGFVKQLMDHVQNGAMMVPKTLPIERIVALSNIVVVEKSR